MDQKAEIDTVFVVFSVKKSDKQKHKHGGNDDNF